MGHTVRPSFTALMSEVKGDPMRSWLRLRAAGAVLTVGGLVVASAPSASAYDVRQTQIVTDNPADWTPNVVSGEVRYLAQSGNTLIAGGNFTQVKNAGSSTVLTRTDVFSFNATTGVVDPNF